MVKAMDIHMIFIVDAALPLPLLVPLPPSSYRCTVAGAGASAATYNCLSLPLLMPPPPS
jgi:hypothetical protein